MLINLTDRNISKRLAKLAGATDERSNYEHLHVKKTKLAVGKKTCQQLIELVSKFRLKRYKSVPIKYNERENYLLNQLYGWCTTVLKDQSLSRTHCIIIDGANKLVYNFR